MHKEQTPCGFATRRHPRNEGVGSIGKRSAGYALDSVSGGNGEGVPPVPIPNTEVKPFSADGTWLDTARESRSPPDSNGHSVMGCPFSFDDD